MAPGAPLTTTAKKPAEPDQRKRPQKKSYKKTFCNKAEKLANEFKKQIKSGASMTLEAFCDENASKFGLAPSTAVSKLGSNRDDWDKGREFFRT